MGNSQWLDVSVGVQNLAKKVGREAKFAYARTVGCDRVYLVKFSKFQNIFSQASSTCQRRSPCQIWRSEVKKWPSQSQKCTEPKSPILRAGNFVGPSWSGMRFFDDSI